MLYTGEYLVNDGTGQLKLHQTITVISTSSGDHIEARISDGKYMKRFYNFHSETHEMYLCIYNYNKTKSSAALVSRFISFQIQNIKNILTRPIPMKK